MSGSIKDKYVPFDSKRFVAVTHNNRRDESCQHLFLVSYIFLVWFHFVLLTFDISHTGDVRPGSGVMTLFFFSSTDISDVTMP